MAWITEAISEIVETGVAPVLKAGGYRRRRRHWMLQLADVTRTVNVQSHHHNSFGANKFTINLGLILHELDERPEGFVTYSFSNSSARVRIGHVMPIGRDYWWELAQDDDFGAVATDVEIALTQHALPWLDRCSDPTEIVDDFFERDFGVSGFHQVARKLGVDIAQRSQQSLERWLSKPVSDLLEENVRESFRWVTTHLALSADSGEELTAPQLATIQALLARDWPMGHDGNSEGERQDIKRLQRALDERLTNQA